MSETFIKFGEPRWHAHDYFHENAFNIILPFWINGRKGILVNKVSYDPGVNPDLYYEAIEQMKADLPGQYERGEIQEPGELIAD